MSLFRPLYVRMLYWAAKPQAVYVLSILSFLEAFIFPLPPEVMLMPMGVSRPSRVFHYAHLSLLFSLLGALIGYFLGEFAFHLVTPLLVWLNILEPILHSVHNLQGMMNLHPLAMAGLLFLAALQPLVPMKLVTWSAGIVGVPLWAFIPCMVLGRGKRLYLLAWLIRRFGERAQHVMNRHMERIGWALLVMLAVGLVWWFIQS